jgi:hypothetical protein
MGDRDLAAIEPDVAAQGIEEGGQALAKAAILAFKLVDGFLKPMGDRHLAAFQPAAEFAFVVALDAVGGSGRDHAHGDAQGTGGVGAAIDQVADEDDLAALGRRDAHRPVAAILGPGDAIAQLAQQGLEFVGAAVDVADDVERAVVVALSVHNGWRVTRAASMLSSLVSFQTWRKPSR